MPKPKALKNWAQTRRRKVTDYVGRFFHELLASLLRARTASGNHDLVISNRIVGLEIGVEVKGGDNNHQLRIPLDQLDRHSLLVGQFPLLDHFIYCLGCYRNKEERNGDRWRQSRLAKCRDEFAVYEFLATHTNPIYILDHQVMLAMRAMGRISRNTLPGQADRETLSLSRRFLAQFNPGNTLYILPYLGLTSANWVIRERRAMVTISLGLLSYRLPLQITEVLPKELMAALDQVTKLPPSGRPAKRQLRLQTAYT